MITLHASSVVLILMRHLVAEQHMSEYLCLFVESSFLNLDMLAWKFEEKKYRSITLSIHYPLLFHFFSDSGILVWIFHKLKTSYVS